MSGCLKGCLTLVLICIVLGLLGNMIHEINKSNAPPQAVVSKPAEPARPKLPPFFVEVGFTGTQFVISNLSSFGCEDAVFEAKTGIFSGFSYGQRRFAHARQYTIGAMLFQDDHGARLNPFSDRASTMVVSCRDKNGNHFSTIEPIRAIR